MAVTIGQPVPVGGNSYRVTWSSDLSDPTFYVWRDGNLIRTTALTSMLFYVAPDGTLSLAVFDSATDVPLESYPGRVTLAWEQASSTDYYAVDYYTGGAWVEQARVFDTGAMYYSWVTAVLGDVTTHQFRVTPIGTNGNTGAVRQFDVLMVRYPDAPSVTMAYNGSATPTVTLTAA